MSRTDGQNITEVGESGSVADRLGYYGLPLSLACPGCGQGNALTNGQEDSTG